MLEKPDISDEELLNCLRDPYRLPINSIRFLPLGADRDTAVYRATDVDGTDYFVKLRRNFDEASILVPAFLHDQGIQQLIAPLKTQSGGLWTPIQDYVMALFPFVNGRDAFDATLSDQHMIEFGQTLKRLHTVKLPPTLMARIPREDFSDRWRNNVRKYQQEISETTYDDPISSALAKLLNKNWAKVKTLINGAAYLADILIADPRPFVLCHADIHVWNILIDDKDRFYVIDWDTVLLAPIERDLMFIGSGLGGKWTTPHETALFYQGYGQTEIDPIGLAYYRMERVVQDISEYCDTIFSTTKEEDRAVGIEQISGQFESGRIVDIAIQSTKNLPSEHQRLIE